MQSGSFFLRVPDVEVNAVGPPVNVSLGAQVVEAGGGGGPS
jgi:hypothetical protein